MPKTNSEVVKQSLSYGRAAFNTGIQVVKYSPYVLFGSWATGTMTLSTVGTVLLSMPLLPVYAAATFAAAPIVYEGSKRLLSQNLQSLPENIKPTAVKILATDLKDPTEDIKLEDLEPSAPLVRLYSRYIHGKDASYTEADLQKPENFQVGTVFVPQDGQALELNTNQEPVQTSDEWVIFTQGARNETDDQTDSAPLPLSSPRL